MANCVCCGQQEEGYVFQALEIRTIPLRELRGERRVQGLGELRQCALCPGCARRRLAAILSPWPGLVRQALPFGGLLLLGLLVLGVLRPADRPFQFFGAAAVLCGAVGLVSGVRTALGRRRAYASLPEREALALAAWDCALGALPRKADDADLTYLPVNEETRAMSYDQLARQFDLLVPIAKEAAERIAALPRETP